MYEPDLEDKVLRRKIYDDVQVAVEGVEMQLKEKNDKKQARTMKKMEKEQNKLVKGDAKLAKKHAKTMKIMEKKNQEKN